METIDKVKSHYNFTSEDIKNLDKLRPLFEKHKERFAGEFLNHVKSFENTAKFLKNEELAIRHQKSMVAWYLDLFGGDYGKEYSRKLQKIGAVHVKIGLPSHYVNAAMYFVRQFCLKILTDELEDAREFQYFSRSFFKILDINLDVMTDSYVEEEVSRFFLFQKLESALIKFSHRFVYGLNLMLVLGLVLMGFIVIILFGYDISHIWSGDIEKGLLSTLGALLMLWVVIELIETEIKHLKGGKFAINVFVGVALVSVIRKILITTLSKDGDVEKSFFLVVTLAVLGVLYWLIAKVEKE